mmetsp:Transcript_17562/g.45230  ORF Transcript_17562/g.45230 Transcript_17562/m.45230 type:complete len:149 (-) Transcript_17562:81-527(-)
MVLTESVGGQTARSKIEADKRSLLTGQGGSRGVGTPQSSQASRDNNAFLEREQAQQQLIMQRQDETLDQIAASAQRLQGAANAVNQELKEQAEMLKELDEDMEKQTEKLNFVMKRMGRLLKTSNNKELCLIIGLFLLMLVLIFLVINT